MKRILIVEDDAATQTFLVEGLRAEGFAATPANGLAKAFVEVQKDVPDLILTDYELRDGTAFDLLNWLNTRDFRVPVVLLTGHSSIDLVVEAVKRGAEQFIPKPVDLYFLTTTLRRVLENSRFQQKDAISKLERVRYQRDPFLGNSPAITSLRKAATRAAKAKITLLIQGETGTGKGVLARWLHKMGPRSNEAFVDINCAGLSRELFESELFGHQKGAFTGAINNKPGFLEAANHGTLFLDEIGDMDAQVQPRILKVVEEKRFYRLGDVIERSTDAQLIAATHRDLKKMSEEGQFRMDLYFRISPLRLRIPPLRERIEDIPAITDTLLEQLGMDMKQGALRISDSARAALLNYSWPGNVRELRNVLERAALLSEDGIIHKTGLEFETFSQSATATGTKSDDLTLKELEKQSIIRALDLESGNVNRAAKRLGIHRSSLYSKMREIGR
ncbi:MAG TPA: sigma-54 dependent transcriptional regulator [Terracidiphilus sp.]